MRQLSIAAAVALLMMTAFGAAADVVLTDVNSTVRILEDPGYSAMYSWNVDGAEQLFQQNFYYRIGTSGRAYDVGELPYSSVQLSSSIYQGTFTGAGFAVDLTYTLMGGAWGSGWSDLGEQVRIRNTSTTSSLSISMFQLSDFDLNDTPGNDTVRRINANLWRQTDGGMSFSETTATPTPSHYEAALFPGLYTKLENPNFDGTLDDIGGPLTGDVMWGWQWDFTIAPNGTAFISKDKIFIPTIPSPESALLGFLGMAAVAARRRS